MQVDNTDVPSYDKFCEMQWDYEWWDWMLADAVEDAKELGMDMDAKDFYFDLYHNSCAGAGDIADKTLFVSKHFDRLMNVSPVLTQMLKEGMLNFSWRTSNNGHLQVKDYDDYGWWHEEDVFHEGIFAGTSVQELYDLETKHDKFEDELLSIVDEFYHELLKQLHAQSDYLTSQEAYEEWIKEWKAEQDWLNTSTLTPTPSNQSVSCAA
jgi:hypothetical protein